MTKGVKTNLSPGDKFGDRVVLGAAPVLHEARRVYVRCKCGKVDAVPASGLTRGKFHRCVSCARKHAAISAAQSSVGTYAGAREIIGLRMGTKNRRGVFFEVRCQCGFVSEIPKSSIAGGNSAMCPACAGKKRARNHALMESANV